MLVQKFEVRLESSRISWNAETGAFATSDARGSGHFGQSSKRGLMLSNSIDEGAAIFPFA